MRELGRAVWIGEPGSRRTGAPDAVHEREASAGADEHILRSDVAVDDRWGVLVEVVERAGGHLEAAQYGAEREAGIAALGDELPERRALDEVHHEHVGRFVEEEGVAHRRQRGVGTHRKERPPLGQDLLTRVVRGEVADLRARRYGRSGCRRHA